MLKKNSNYVACILCFVIGISLYVASAAAWAAYKSSDPVQAASTPGATSVDPGVASNGGEDPGAIFDVASPHLTPEEVVVRQVEAMQRGVEDLDAMRVCYALAAPQNRQHIGSFERFAAVALSAEYEGLFHASRWMAGEPVIVDGIALVTVTAVTPQPGADLEPLVWGYRFILQRQAGERYRDCWMTLAVENLTPANVLTRRANSSAEGDLEI